MSKPHFEVYRSGRIWREWRWRLRAGNGEPIASGEGYRARSDCLAAVELVQALAPGAGLREVNHFGDNNEMVA